MAEEEKSRVPWRKKYTLSTYPRKRNSVAADLDDLDKLNKLFQKETPPKTRKAPKTPIMRNCPARDHLGLLPIKPKRKPSGAPPGSALASTASSSSAQSSAPSDYSPLEAETVILPSSYDPAETSDTVSSSVQELEQLLADLTKDVQPPTKRPWAMRQHKVVGQWEEAHPYLMRGLLSSFKPMKDECCSSCPKNASVKCQQCPGSFFCMDCDLASHLYSPLHDRSLINIHYSYPLQACQLVADTEELQFVWKPFFLPVLPKETKCRCGSKSWIACEEEPQASLKTCLVITLNGRYDVFLPQRRCKDCNFVVTPCIESLISAGFWPGSPKITSGMYIFSREVLCFFDLLVKEKPSMSMRAFLSTLEQISTSYKRVSTINPTVFSTSLREWRRCQMQLQREADVLPTSCSACSSSPHAIHIDGNKKLYRYRNEHMFPSSCCKVWESDVCRGWNIKLSLTRSFVTPYSEEVFIAPDEEVNAFVNYIKSDDKQETSNTCGGSHFQAARTASKSFRSLDETGLCVACCRHCVILGSLNMYQGEIFPYPLYLLRDLIQKGHSISYLCQDVICKFWPWLQRILVAKEDDECLQKLNAIKPFLGVMHGKAHEWACQILWGGRWMEGSGTMSGEEMELCFSYLSAAGFITKGMSKAARDEQITEHMLHWNKKKLEKMATILTSKYKKTLRDLESLHVSIIPLSTIKVWKQDLQNAAKGHVNRTEFADLTDDESEFVVWASSQDSLDEATSLLMQSAVVKKHKRRSRLVTASVAQVDNGRRKLAVRVSKTLEAKIEQVYSAVQCHTDNISKLADSSKQRHSIRKKRAEEKGKLHKLVQEWMVLQPEHSISEEAESAGDWPWLEALIPDSEISLKAKKDAVDKMEHMARMLDEKAILHREMRTHLSFLKSKMLILRDKISSCSNSVGYLGLYQFHLDKYQHLFHDAVKSYRECLENLPETEDVGADGDLQALLEDFALDIEEGLEEEIDEL